MTCTSRALALAVTILLAFGLTAAGSVVARPKLRRSLARSAGTPYRTASSAAILAEQGPPATLLAAGNAFWGAAMLGVLTTALVTLRWEGIGVALLPAMAIAIGRLYGSSVALRERDVGPLRMVATAALLLDVPLVVFAFVHVALGDAHHGREELSLAVVAAAYAVVDGLQAALVRLTRSHA